MSIRAPQASAEPTHNGVLEVSDLTTDRVRRYAREAGTAYLERKAGRTFLVTDGA
jgi:hypothetical protein